ncbi:MFS transporter [Desulfolucanica intricata]|uniref:MFS transporter n=1 Tax=Desulfolucanica intricata TaxID=1285191 RepID=UPI00082FA3D5|nr:MFS transporter [Desulfolucanica intricata]
MRLNKRVLTLLSTGHAVTDISQGALPIILAYLQPVFALSQMQVGLVMLVSNLSSSVIQPVFGVLSDRFRAVWLVPLGCLLAGLGIAFTGISLNYATLLLAALVSGLGVAAYHPEGSKFARFASGKQKAFGMSLFSVGGNFGFAAGPILAGSLLGAMGLGGTLGFIILNSVMALLLWVNLSSITATQVAGQGMVTEHGQENSSETIVNFGIKKVIFPVILLVLVVIMRSWVHLGLVTFLPQYYVHYLHQSEAYAATLTSVFLFAGALGTLLGGPMADRLGLKEIITGSMALLVILLFLFIHLSGIWIPVLVALTGFAVISTFAVTVVFGQELMPNNLGLASGLMLGFAIGMGGVGTTLLGWVADHFGLPAVFKVMIIFPVIGLLLALFLPDQKKLSEIKAGGEF